MDNDCGNEKSVEALQNYVASIWQCEIMACSNCWSEDKQPILRPSRQKENSDFRWRNRYRVPHIGSEFGVSGPRIVFVGLEDPYTLENPVNPLTEMNKLGEYLTTSLGRGDRHRWGELYLAHDLLGIPGASTGTSIFNRIATINSHLCSLVSGDGRQSASHKLLHACDFAWRIIFTELNPDIVILESKQFVWGEALAKVERMGWPIKDLACHPASDKVRLFKVQAPRHDFYILALIHPSRSWCTRNYPYYRDIINPTVAELRRLIALDMSEAVKEPIKAAESGDGCGL